MIESRTRLFRKKQLDVMATARSDRALACAYFAIATQLRVRQRDTVSHVCRVGNLFSIGMTAKLNCVPAFPFYHPHFFSPLK